MTNAEILGIAATAAGIVMAVAPVLQIRRMRKTGSSRDFSLLYATLLCVGFVLWLLYGVALTNWPMMVSNAFSLTFMVVTILVALVLRRGPGKPREAPPEAAPEVAPPGA